MPKYAVLSAVNVEGVFYKAGAVVDVTDALAKPLVAGGYLESNKEAVAFRESEGEKVVKHVKPETADSVEAKDAEKR